MKKTRPINYFVLNEANKQAIQIAARDTVTQGEIMTRAACPRKWFYRYALMLDRLSGPNYHLIYGSAMHEALKTLYQSSGHYGETPKEYPIEVPKIIISENIVMSPDDLEEMQTIKAKVQIAFDSYRTHYYKEDSHMFVRKVEETFELEWKGVKLNGRIDLVANPKLRDGIFIWDFKTAGRFDASMLDVWSFRFQFLYYAWLYWRATGNRPSGIMANGLGKTLLRPRQIKLGKGETRKETRQEYIDRVRLDYRENRTKYFYRQRMPLAKGMLEKFEKEILGPHIMAFQMLEFSPNSPLAMAMNTGHCHVYNSICEYLPLCKDGPLMLGEYYKREMKHPELVNEKAMETD